MPSTALSTERRFRTEAAPRPAAEPIDPAHLESVERGMEQARRGHYASDDEIEAIYRLAGL